MLGELFALLAAFAWATVGIIMALMVRRMDYLTIVTARLLLGTFFLLPVVVMTAFVGRIGPLPVSSIGLLVASGVISLGIGDTLYVMSLPLIGVSRAHPISITLSPLFTFILAAMLIGEVITPATLVGSCLVIIGVVLVVRSGRALRQDIKVVNPGHRGLIMIVTAAILWAVGLVFLKMGVTDVDPVISGSIRLLAGGLFLAGIMFWRRPKLNLRQLTGRQRSGLVWIGLMTALSPGFFIVMAMRYAGAGKVSVLIATSPLFAFPLAFLFLGERITWRTIIGSVLAIAGVWLVVAA